MCTVKVWGDFFLLDCNNFLYIKNLSHPENLCQISAMQQGLLFYIHKNDYSLLFRITHSTTSPIEGKKMQILLTSALLWIIWLLYHWAKKNIGCISLVCNAWDQKIFKYQIWFWILKYLHVLMRELLGKNANFSKAFFYVSNRHGLMTLRLFFYTKFLVFLHVSCNLWCHVSVQKTSGFGAFST